LISNIKSNFGIICRETDNCQPVTDEFAAYRQ
jgi:hypothetical protein